jgi:hypothetical protein
MKENDPSGDPRPRWLVTAQAPGTDLGEINVDGHTYTYTVIKAGLAGDLPYGVGFSSETTLMISEDAPERYRPFVLAHEVREKTRFADLPEEERCRAALELELADVRANPNLNYAEYLIDRTAFFDALVVLYEQTTQANAVTPDFIAGIQGSRDYLHNLTRLTPEAIANN